MPLSHTVYIALGSNLGDRRANIHSALEALNSIPSTSVRNVSDLLETAPVGPPGQGMYLNAAVELATALEPRELLNHLLAIETSLGRTREPDTRWTARTIDLDILLFADLIIAETGLTIPHPHLAQREFVLRPLAQIAPSAMHPLLRLTVQSLLESLLSHEKQEFPVPVVYRNSRINS